MKLLWGLVYVWYQMESASLSTVGKWKYTRVVHYIISIRITNFKLITNSDTAVIQPIFTIAALHFIIVPTVFNGYKS